jgi:acetolactate synthase small subunit
MTIQFRVLAEAEPQCLSRLIDHFAQRGLIPSSLSTMHVGRDLEIVIEHPTVEERTARIICERIARAPSVARATMIRLRHR